MIAKYANIVAGVVLLFILATMSTKIVSPGHRGVKITMGKVSDESYPEGFYFYLPFISSIKEMDTRISKIEIRTDAYTKDVQQVHVTGVVNFYPERDKMHTLYKEVGTDWADKLIPQMLEGNLKNIIGHYEAVDLVDHRQEATIAIEQALQAAAKDRNVSVTKFEIANLDFQDIFEKAVEEKVTAIQRAKEAQNNTIRIQEEANQKVISAQAEAKSMSIRATALTQNASLVQYEAVQKWDGHLPTYMMGNSTPFINLK